MSTVFESRAVEGLEHLGLGVARLHACIVGGVDYVFRLP